MARRAPSFEIFIWIEQLRFIRRGSVVLSKAVAHWLAGVMSGASLDHSCLSGSGKSRKEIVGQGSAADKPVMVSAL